MDREAQKLNEALSGGWLSSLSVTEESNGEVQMAFELPQEKYDLLWELAQARGQDVTTYFSDFFNRALFYALEKNQELYDRLS